MVKCLFYSLLCICFIVTCTVECILYFLYFFIVVKITNLYQTNVGRLMRGNAKNYFATEITIILAKTEFFGGGTDYILRYSITKDAAKFKPRGGKSISKLFFFIIYGVMLNIS